MQVKNKTLKTYAVLAAATAGLVPLAQQARATDAFGNQVTVSLSGSTALRNFQISPGITYLTPGQSITLGPTGSEVTYTAPSGSTPFQLAPTIAGTTSASNVPGITLEYHASGSVEGILEMLNDQANAGANTGLGRTATGSNQIYINQNTFTSPSTINGYTSGSPIGQAPVQLAVSDVVPVQGFAVGGTLTLGSLHATPGANGYGKGNPALTNSVYLNGLGTSVGQTAGQRQQLQDATETNLGAAQFGSGPWNSATTGNLNSSRVAVTATLLTANPGTGLTKFNRTDSQWLQTTGRLQNGALFNVAEREGNSGTRNVLALNSGVDPSWAVGANDGGNGYLDTGSVQEQIGPNLKFSGKTAGGTLRTTVQVNRMAVGPLGMSDALTAVNGSSTAIPLRGLDYSDSTDGSSGYVRSSAATITDGSYAIYQNEQYVTIKAPKAANAGLSVSQYSALTDAQTGVQGDNTGNDVLDFKNNILNSVANFPPPTTVADPADQLLATSFILPQMMQKEKSVDGVNTQSANPGYSDSLRQGLLGSTYASKFTVADPSTVTTGSSAVYGGAGTTVFAEGSIPITSANYLFGNFNQNGVRDFSSIKSGLAAAVALYNSGAGVDMNSGSLNATSVPGLSTALGSKTKGDLIVLGDYNGDGKFDGRDMYLMATGAALSNNTGTDSLTTGDYRTGILRKNDALDYMQTNTNDGSAASSAIRTSARNAYQIEHNTNTTGALSFSKFDIDHSGTLDRNDAAIVDKFIGKDYTNLDDTLGATINSGPMTTYATGDLSPGATNQRVTSGNQIQFNLISAKLIDGASQILRTDFNLLATNLISLGVLDAGDVNFDGTVDNKDINSILGNFGNIATSAVLSQFSSGDVNGDGVIDNKDLTVVLNDFGNVSGAVAIYNSDHLSNDGVFYDPQLGVFTAVPEPASLSVIALASAAMLGRRRRSR